MDTGAYYFTNHFDYNSLPRAAVYAAAGDGSDLRMSQIRPAGTLGEVLRAMSGP